MRIRDLAPFTIRIPLELKNRLKKVAEEKLRWSVNSEILKRLEDSFEIKSDLKNFTVGELIDELIRRDGLNGLSIRIGKEQERPETVQHEKRERRGDAITRHVDFEVELPKKDKARKKE